MKTAFGICLQYFIPMRREDSDRSEMVSQILFGETFRITSESKQGKFALIKADIDGYEGWIDTRTIRYMDEKTYFHYTGLQPLILHKNVSMTSSSPGYPPLKAGAGSTFRPENGMLLPDLDMYTIPPDLTQGSATEKRSRLMTFSEHFISVPYLWGGRSDAGTDCSGLVQNLFRQAGIPLPRDASQQALTGKTLSFISEARPGDLAFFDNEDGVIVHTGIIMDNHKIIHASGRVRIDKIDHQGIYSGEDSKYTHKLRVLKNVID